MSDPLTDLLHSRSHEVRPRLLSAADIRRTAERKRRNRVIVGGVAVGMAALVLAMGVTGQTSLAPTPGPATTPSPSPSGSGDTLSLAADPFMTAADWNLVMSAAPPESLSPCVTDPMTWNAAESRRARYVDPGQPGTVYNEFVLRFDSAADAHRAIAAAWRTFTDCPTPAEGDPELPLPLAGSNDYVIDEAFWGQRVDATPRHAGSPVSVYAVRVARRGNVLVLVEDIGEPDDRAQHVLHMALSSALRNP